LAEPPSVVGIGGGQTDEAAPGAAAAVVLGPWVEVSGISPGNSTGDWDDADAEPVAPAAPLADPAVVADPADVPDCDADEGDDIDDGEDVDDREGVDDVGTLRGSDSAVVPLLLVWPFGCNTVSPWTVVIPRNITAMMMMNFIALSRVEYRGCAPARRARENARSAKNENEI
jgi:hypothetical protein